MVRFTDMIAHHELCAGVLRLRLLLPRLRTKVGFRLLPRWNTRKSSANSFSVMLLNDIGRHVRSAKIVHWKCQSSQQRCEEENFVPATAAVNSSELAAPQSRARLACHEVKIARMVDRNVTATQLLLVKKANEMQTLLQCLV